MQDLTPGWAPRPEFPRAVLVPQALDLRPALQTPASGSALTFPSNPIVLKWAGVPGAAHYLVSVASDPTVGSLVLHYPNQDDPKGPPNVAATSAAITSAPAPGPYYWNVVPVDAEGNRGVATQTSAFSWLWNSVNAATMTDLDPAPEAFDLRFSCNPIPGAARYEVEINSSVDFAPGSKVCCTAAEADDLYRCARRSAASSSSPRRRPATSPRTGS